jgi:trans-aconitate methyltransferase
MTDWSEYYAATLEKPLHPLFEHIEPWLPAPGLALDAGCGVGHATLRMLDLGWRVTALDAEPEAIDILRSRLPDSAPCEAVVADVSTYPLGRYRAVLAMFSLFFLPPERFAELWPRLRDAVDPGGLFAGQFLGWRDAWRDRGYTLHDRTQVEALFDGWTIRHLEEVERQGETAVGEPKYWHVFHVVATKPVSSAA